MFDPASHLPEEVPHELIELGYPTQVFETKSFTLWILRLSGFLCFGPAAVCIFAFFVPFGKAPPPPAVLIGVGCVFAAIGLLCLAKGFLVREPKWLLFSDAVVELRGHKVQIFRWAEISELVQEALPKTGTAQGPPPIRYTLTTYDGRTCSIDFSVSNRSQLVGEIAARLKAYRVET